jgi:hemerythrin superfamily protein
MANILSGLIGRLFNVERSKDGTWNYQFVETSDFLNSEKYLDISLSNPVLSTIIALRSKMYSQMEIKHLNSKGDVIENSPYTKLLNNPNYFQSKEDFFFQQMWFLSATGNDYVYQKKAFIDSVPKALYNLIPSELDFKDTQKVKKFITDKQDVKTYNDQTIVYKLDDQKYTFKIGDLIPFYDMANGLKVNSFMCSPSRVKSIMKPLENIEQNLKSKFVNLEMSQKYVVANKSTTDTRILQQGDKDNIQRSLGSKSIFVSSSDIQANHMISDLKRLYLDEQFANDALKCLLAFDLNKDVLNYFGNGSSTFENQEKGELRYLQNSIMTTANSTMNSFSSQWGLLEKGERLVASYDHLNIMQPVMVDKLNTFKVFQETIALALVNQTMDISEAKLMTQDLKIKLGL